MISKSRAKKRRLRSNPAKAPRSCTPTVQRYLESFLHGSENRQVATAALLGCSLRTAARLTNKKKPFTGAWKVAWVCRLCAETGKDVESVLGKERRTFGQVMVGWMRARTSKQAMQDAVDIAHAILFRATEAFHLSGSMFVVMEGKDPERVDLQLYAASHLTARGGIYAPYHITIAPDFSAGFMRLNMRHPLLDFPYSKELTTARVEKLLRHVYKHTEKVRSELAKEAKKLSKKLSSKCRQNNFNT